jgi:hypothetical protein
MKNGNNIKWIVRSDVKESNEETIELVGGQRLPRVCNKVIWYYVLQESKKGNKEMYKL